MITIKPCLETDVSRYFEAARQEHLSFIPKTDFYAAYVRPLEIAGFCGIVWHTNYALFKNDYVLPAYRGQGIARIMLKHRLQIVREKNVTEVRANVNPKSINYYRSAGAQVIKQFKHNAVVKFDLSVTP